jgi:hypothetical protein
MDRLKTPKDDLGLFRVKVSLHPLSPSLQSCFESCLKIHVHHQAIPNLEVAMPATIEGTPSLD